MIAALLACGAGHVRNGTPSINNKSEALRGRSDPKLRAVVPVEEEIVVEPHSSVVAGSIEI